MTVVAFGLGDLEQRKRYDSLFEACPHAFIQQSTGWAEVIQDLGPDRPVFLLHAEAGVDLAGLPLYLYESSHGNILTSVPQAGPLGGVFLREGLAPELREAAYAALISRALELARTLECLTLTIITSPFDDDLAVYERHLRPEIVFENFTQWIPLDRELKLSGGQRNNLARARRFGFRIAEVTTDAELRAWYTLHQRRQQQIGSASPPLCLFERIFTLLAPRQHARFLCAFDGERLASGCLYITHRHVVDVYAINMESEYTAHAPNALVTHAALDWARSRGARAFNWQSSPSRASGVYTFKRQWGSLESPYYFVTRLLDPERLTRLDADRVRAEYAGHYVVPFAAFQQGFDVRRFAKS